MENLTAAQIALQLTLQLNDFNSSCLPSVLIYHNRSHWWRCFEKKKKMQIRFQFHGLKALKIAWTLPRSITRRWSAGCRTACDVRHCCLLVSWARLVSPLPRSNIDHWSSAPRTQPSNWYFLIIGLSLKTTKIDCLCDYIRIINLPFCWNQIYASGWARGRVAQLSFVGHHADFCLSFWFVIKSVCTWTARSLESCDSNDCLGPSLTILRMPYWPLTLHTTLTHISSDCWNLCI